MSRISKNEILAATISCLSIKNFVIIASSVLESEHWQHSLYRTERTKEINCLKIQWFSCMSNILPVQSSK